VDIKEVSRRLGHARIQTTLDIYQHLYPEQDDAAALSGDDLLNTPESPKKKRSTGQGMVRATKKARLENQP
jgi:hypothetical protein